MGYGYYDELDARNFLKRDRRDKRDKRKVAMYARVSTTHEDQLMALESQIEWYHKLIQHNEKNWIIDKDKDIYIDEGISGTSLKNRDSFNIMIDKAKSGKYDLIVVRDTSRFMRNLKETLNLIDELKSCNVEVHFVQDNLWTFDSEDCEQLVDTAKHAEKESKNTSQKVFAGHASARREGVVFGNGNILGYKREEYIDDNGRAQARFVVDEEQANTVRKMFDLALNGYSFVKIKNYLQDNGYKTANGMTKWHLATIGRILHKVNYIGKYEVFQSVTQDPLSHKRKIIPKDEREIFDGGFPPIIDKEVFYKVQEILKEKEMMVEGRVRGCNVSKDEYLKVLRCGCGRKFRKDMSRTDDRATYRCYRVVEDGSQELRRKNSMMLNDNCCVDGIIDWKLDLFTYKVFENLQINISTIKDRILEKFDRNYVINLKEDGISSVKDEIETLEIKKKRLRDLYIKGDYSEEEYDNEKTYYDIQINELLTKLENLADVDEDMYDKEYIIARKRVEKYLDDNLNIDKRSLKGNKVSGKLIDIYIKSIKACANSEFEYVIDLSKNKEFDIKMNNPNYVIENSEDSLMFEFTVDYDEAKAYANSISRKVKRVHFQNPVKIRVYAYRG